MHGHAQLKLVHAGPGMVYHNHLACEAMFHDHEMNDMYD